LRINITDTETAMMPVTSKYKDDFQEWFKIKPPDFHRGSFLTGTINNFKSRTIVIAM